MILLRSDGPPSRAIALFGRGLIGSAIVAELECRGFARVRETDLPWAHPSEFALRMADAENTISAAFRASDGEPPALIWSAGRAGFEANDAEAAAELRIFESIVGLARRVADAAERRIVFVFFGSAGGLFEGQRVVGPSSIPAPRRPYGRVKLEMENLLRSASDRIEPAIFRLASAYGLPVVRHRRGLIPTLISNAFEGRVSRIVGTPSTLRDFVWVADVARFVVSRLLEGIAGNPVLTLAACRPASILEIRKRIEERLGRRLYLSYAGDPSNREDITFATTTMPEGWRPSDLATNIGLIAKGFLASHPSFVSA